MLLPRLQALPQHAQCGCAARHPRVRLLFPLTMAATHRPAAAARSMPSLWLLLTWTPSWPSASKNLLRSARVALCCTHCPQLAACAAELCGVATVAVAACSVQRKVLAHPLLPPHPPAQLPAAATVLLLPPCPTTASCSFERNLLMPSRPLQVRALHCQVKEPAVHAVLCADGRAAQRTAA